MRNIEMPPFILFSVDLDRSLFILWLSFHLSPTLSSKFNDGIVLSPLFKNHMGLVMPKHYRRLRAGWAPLG